MVICDVCQDVKAKATEYRLAILRPGEDQDRTRHSRVKDAPVEICERCVAHVWEAVKKAAEAVKGTRVPPGPELYPTGTPVSAIPSA